MSTINYLTVRNTVLPVVNAVTANYSTLTGSTLRTDAIATSTITVRSLNIASTMISLGQSTNQTYNNFSNGSFAPVSWVDAKSAMSSANKTVQSANGLYQMIIGNTTSGLFLSSDSGITWTTLTGGLPTLTGSAYWSDGAISANGQYITLSVYGGSLWMSADYGRTFALTNQPTPDIWLPLNGNTTDSMGSSTVTPFGSPSYVTVNRPGYTAQAINLLNTAGGTATRYIRGTWAGATNFTVSGWFNPQSLTGVFQVIFSTYSGYCAVLINTSNQLFAVVPSGGGLNFVNVGLSSTLSINTWYYFSLSFQTNGTCSLYLNNTLLGSVTNTQGVDSLTTSIFGLSGYDGNQTFAFNGYLSDVEITNSVSAYVPLPHHAPNIWLPFENSAGDLGSHSMPPSATPFIHLPFEGNVTDSVGTSAPVATGAVTYVPVNREGYTGQAIRLTNTAGGTATQFVRGSWTGASNITVSFWFNAQSVGAPSNQILFSAYVGAYAVYINTSNRIMYYIPSGGTALDVVTGPVISINTWYYVTAIFQTNGTCSLFVNNSLAGTYTNSGGVSPYATTTFGIGTYDTTLFSSFNGTVDDLRIYNSAIPYVPVSNTTVTGSLSYVPGIVGLNAVNLVNTAGGAATNYIRGTVTQQGVYTISGWFNMQSYPANTQIATVVSLGGNPAGSVHIYYLNNNSGNTGLSMVAYTSTPAVITIGTTSNISLNTWYHIHAIYQQSGTCSFHVNGTLIGSIAGQTLFNMPTGFGIGTYSQFVGAVDAFNGYVDDFRIYNAAIPFHILAPQNYRSLALSGTGQYALAATAAGWVVGSSDTSRTWEKEAVTVGTQSNIIQPNMTGLAQTQWEQNGVNWVASESSNNGSTQSVSRAFNNTLSSDAWLSNNVTQRYTAGSPNGNADRTNIQTIGLTAGEWIQIQSSVPVVLSSFAFGIGLNAYPSTATPKTYYIVGSNDGSTWVPLQFGNFTISAFTSSSSNIIINITGTQTLTGTMVGSVATTAYSFSNNAYTYFRLIGTSLMVYGGSAGTTYMEVGEWYLNFVRPLTISRPPASLLSMNHSGQYQMVATGPAAGSIMPNQTGLLTNTWSQGGVNWGVNTSTTLFGYFPYRLFDNIQNNSWANSLANYTPSGNSSGITTVIQGVGITTGDWAQIQSSVPLVMASYQFGSGGGTNQLPKTYYIVGSNDGSTWFPIQYGLGGAVTTTAPYTTVPGTIIVNSASTQTFGSSTITTTIFSTTTNAYTYFRLIGLSVYFTGNGYLEIGEWLINFRNSVSYSTNFGSTWLNTSPTVSNESVALSASGQYTLSTNSVAPFARLTLDNTNVDAQGVLVPATGAGTVTYSTSIKAVGSHSAFFNQTAGSTTPTMYLNYIVPTLLNTPSILTMSCWMYMTALPASGISIPMSFSDTGNTVGGVSFFIGTNGTYMRFAYTATISGYAEINYSPSILTNVWYHLVGVASAGVTQFYVNGTLIGSGTYSGLLCLTAGANMSRLMVGAQYVSGTFAGAFHGYVDDVRIYTSALNADEINGLFRNPALTQTIAVSSSYLPITSYTEPTLPGINANIVDKAVSQTGQYMVAVTSSTTNNVYYSTDYGATFTALTIGTTAMVSCSISYDGSYLMVSNATTTLTLNRNTRGFTLAVGNQAGQINQGLNAIAIGDKAGRTNQSANSIVLNASGSALDAIAPGFYVAPIGTADSSSLGSFSVLGYGTDSHVVQTGLRVLQNGSVGIGSAVPTSYFQLADGLTSEISGSFKTQYTSLGYTAATLANPNAANGSVSGPVNGVYTFTLNSGGQDAYYNSLLPAGAFVQISITVRSSSSNVQLAIIDTTNFSYYYLTPVLTNTLTTYTFTARISSSTQLFTRLLGGSNGSSWSWSNFSVQRMDTLMTGNVGIGVTAPASALHVVGTVTANTFSAPTGNFLNITNGAGSGSIALQGSSILFQNSFVGIGIANPSVQLHVAGTIVNVNSAAFSYFAPNIGIAASPNGPGVFNSVIYAVGGIVSTASIACIVFSSFSDVRIKKNIESYPSSVLDLLLQFRVVSYDHIDFKNGHIKAGLIAQEVEQIAPSCVKQKKEYIPNIYSLGTHYLDGDNVIITVIDTNGVPKDVSGIEIGASRKIFLKVLKNGTTEHDINEEIVTHTSTQFTVRKWSNYCTDDTLFVYGTEIDDFRVLDKDVISMMGIKAIQELSKQATSQSTLVQELAKQNTELTQKLDTLSASHAALLTWAQTQGFSGAF